MAGEEVRWGPASLSRVTAGPRMRRRPPPRSRRRLVAVSPREGAVRIIGSRGGRHKRRRGGRQSAPGERSGADRRDELTSPHSVRSSKGPLHVERGVLPRRGSTARITRRELEVNLGHLKDLLESEEELATALAHGRVLRG